MVLLFLGVGLLLIIGLFAFLLDKTQKKEPEHQSNAIPSDCCGAHEVCERDSLLSKTNEIIYFDDEELDELSDIDPKSFTDGQRKKLEDVFYTLRESDVAGWLRSLQLRNIHLPEELKEEAFLIVRERRHL